MLAVLPLIEFWKLAKFGESLLICHKYRCTSFQICIIRKLSFSTSHKSDQRLIAFNMYIIPDHMFDIPQTVFRDGEFWPFSKSNYHSEAVHRKLKFKVLSTNICNKTWWHRSPSVCDQLQKFTDFALFTVDSPLHRMSDSAGLYFQIALIFPHIDLIVFQTTVEASRVHVYTHFADF